VRRYQLAEYESLDGVGLTAGQAAALAATRAVEVLPAADRERWTVRASSYVGVLRIDDTELWIRPKVTVDRLLYLLGYATDAAGWRVDEDVSLAAADDLVPAMAIAFAAQAHRTLQQGLLQGYRVMEESLTVVRGRLLVREQLRRRPGLAVPLEVRYDDFTVDIAENQLLLSAALRLLRAPGVLERTRGALLRLAAQLADVTALVRGQPLPAVRFSRLNERYRPAVRLAELVLRGRSIEAEAGGVRATGFLFDMNRVFEDYVTAALKRELPAYGGYVRAQHRSHMDLAGRIPIRPDVTWWRTGRCMSVVDAKYKALRTEAFPNADLYQMLAYCTVLSLPLGYLVYAAGNENSTEHVVRKAGTIIVVHAVRLNAPIPALAAEMKRLAGIIAQS
jgi:5-methylcytosine-specific restriction enzyme subunit McrC